MNDSITHAGAIFLLFLFISIVVFYTLSDPIVSILNGILGLDGMTSSGQIDRFVPNFKTAVKIGFALFISTPVVWFIVKIFSREPAYYYNKRRRGGGGGTF